MRFRILSRTNDSIKENEEKERLERERLMAERREAFVAAMNQWSEEERGKADVARSIKYLNELEKDLYFYTNLMRLDPKKFKKAIWDEGPFFDQLLPELKETIHQNAQYKKVSRWLETSGPQLPVVPESDRIESLRCLIEKYLEGGRNHNDCFKLAGGWRLQTYYPESSFNDVMNILLTPDDFQDLFEKGGSVAIESGNPSVKVFFTPN